MADTLALAGFYSLVVGVLYAYVGGQLSRRKVPPEGRLAHRMFMVWWFALAASSLNGALNIGLYRAEALRPAYYLVSTQVGLLAVVLALLGLLYYMVYIYTGSSRWFKPIVAFYVLFYVFLLALVAYLWNPPTGFTDNGWTLQPLPENEDLNPGVSLFFVLLLIGPQIGAAMAFLRLASKLEDPTSQYRVRLLGTAILLWFGIALVGSLMNILAGMDLSTNNSWQYLTRAIGFSAVLTILAAYKPPRWVQRKYNIEPI